MTDLLRLACELERSETEQKYPEFAETARGERSSAESGDDERLLYKAERRFEALAAREDDPFERFDALLVRRIAATDPGGEGPDK